jgi:hypothetical protein
MTAPVGSRLVFPEDRTLFVYQKPGQPILSPPRVGVQLFEDEACTVPADVRTLSGSAIPYSTIYVNDDTLLPEFLGPQDYVVKVWAQVVGGNGEAYALNAQYSGRIALSPTLGSGVGSPDPDFGSAGSFYVDRGAAEPFVSQPVLYGPKAEDGWPTEGVLLAGVPGPPGGTVMVPINVATATWELPYDSDFPATVTTIDSAGEEIYGDVTYPSTGLVVVEFGAPTTGVGILRI